MLLVHRFLLRPSAKLIERLFDIRIVREAQLCLLFEEYHLKTFFSQFGVDCVFDVGANAGQYADMLRQQVKFKGPIISFEPDPSLASRLLRRAKEHDNWYIQPVALTDREGTVNFNISSNNQFSSIHTTKTNETKLFVEIARPLKTI